MTGHSLGAVGTQELIYCLLMMNHEFIAPTINIQNLDDAAKDFDIVTQTRPTALNSVMSNSFGFGGTNAALVSKNLTIKTTRSWGRHPCDLIKHNSHLVKSNSLTF